MSNKGILGTEQKDLKFSITTVVTMANDHAISDNPPLQTMKNYQYSFSILNPENTSQINHFFFFFLSNESKEPWKSNLVLNVLVNHLLCGSFNRNTGVKLITVKFKAANFGKYFSKIIETIIICWYQNSLYILPSSIKPITFIEHIPSA